jgi:hypothetical protein
MEVIHIAQNTDGYEIVTLIANRVSRQNHFSLIQKGDEVSYTGGFILNDTERIRKILDAIPKEDQYDFVKEFKVEPWVRSYADEPWGDEPALNLEEL